MSGLYSIPLSGLKEGHHSFNFKINSRFFDLFEESEIKEGSLNVNVEAEKRSSLIEMNINISGIVRISCDRCLGVFDQRIDCGNRLLVQLGSGKDENDPDIVPVARDEKEIDLSQFVYEFIHLALPIQRIHPDDDEGKSTCDQFMLEKLKEHLVNEETRVDPRWEELKKLINDN